MLELSLSLSKTRRVAALVIAAALVAVVAACGNTRDSRGGGSAEPNKNRSAAAGGRFPVTVDSIHGDVTVPTKPQRVVFLAFLDGIPAVAAGLDPLAIGTWFDWDQNTIDKRFPWVKDKLSLDQINTDILNSDREINLEAVLNLDPDLIIGNPWMLKDKSLYDKLSKIAPTFAGNLTTEDSTLLPTSMTRETMRAWGGLTGESETVEKAIAGSEEKFTAMRTRLSGLKGKTYQGVVHIAETRQYMVYRYRALEDLGMEPAKKLKEAPLTISEENIGELDADVLIFMSANIAETRESLLHPGYKNLPAVRNNAVIIEPEAGTFDVMLKLLPGPEDYIDKEIADPLTKSSYASDGKPGG